jgi:hypothetical protein
MRSTQPRRLAERVARFHLTRVDAQASPTTPDGHADVRRAREAGGPIDRAQYSCDCGYVFQADVSTSVACPHCGHDQAW